MFDSIILIPKYEMCKAFVITIGIKINFREYIHKLFHLLFNRSPHNRSEGNSHSTCFSEVWTHFLNSKAKSQLNSQHNCRSLFYIKKIVLKHSQWLSQDKVDEALSHSPWCTGVEISYNIFEAAKSYKHLFKHFFLFWTLEYFQEQIFTLT